MQPFYYHFKSKISGMIATNYNPKARKFNIQFSVSLIQADGVGNLTDKVFA